jgi:hypothetical protein
MKTDVIIAWVVIGIIGVVLYAAPTHILKLVKEGFHTIVNGVGVSGDVLTPKQLDTLMTVVGSPNFYGTETSSSGGKAQPDGVSGSTESKSSDADVKNVSCASSGQGIAYRKMTDPGAPSSANMKTQDSCLPEPIPENSPKCPDLKDYIRKDKIPCWGCKL